MELENETCLSGLRNPKLAVEKVPGLWQIGMQIRAALEKLLQDDSAILDACLRGVGVDGDEAGPTKEMTEAARHAIFKTLNSDVIEDLASPDLPTPIQHSLLAAWRRCASDPDDQVDIWLREGAPAGLARLPLERGIFPAIPEDLRGPCGG